MLNICFVNICKTIVGTYHDLRICVCSEGYLCDFFFFFFFFFLDCLGFFFRFSVCRVIAWPVIF